MDRKMRKGKVPYTEGDKKVLPHAKNIRAYSRLQLLCA